jgi:DNA-binding response OmpR family regulator
VLTIKLQKAGYYVVSASDGEEGLEIAMAESPDLIITDYQMPCLDGLEMSRRYRAQSGRAVPAMVITAREFDIDRDQLEGTGVSVVLPKPFSPREVVGTIENLLRQAHVTDETGVPGESA